MLNSLLTALRRASHSRRALLTTAGILLAGVGVSANAAETTVSFNSTEPTAWNDGIAEDGDGGSVNISGKVIQFYPISSTSGTHLNLPLVHGDSFQGDGFMALTTYDPSVQGTGFKGMAIRSQDGSAFQINGFFYSNYGEGGPITITVKGYNDGGEVASTSFATAPAGWWQSKSVTLDSTFDHVDEVRLYSSGTSWHGINNIKINDAVAVNNAPTDIQLSNASVNQSGGVNAAVGTLSTTDPDGDLTFTYTLVEGDGDTDNASFNVSESSLRVNDAGALAAGEYSVRVQTDDNNGGTYAEAFTVTVTPGTFIWSGAEDAGREWTRPGNWLGNVVPPAGADLLFPADAIRRESINNRYSGFVVRSITIEANFYDIYGEPIILLNGLTTTFDGGSAFFSLNTTLDTVQSFDLAAGGELICFGTFSGSQGLTKTGGGTLRLVNANDNNYAGTTTVQAGTLLLTARNGAIAVPTNLTIADGATVRFHGSTDYDGSTIGENQTASATTVTLGEGATFDLNGRTNTIAGLTLQGGAVLTGANGRLTVTGGVAHNASANHVTSTIQGPGVLDLGGGDRAFAVANDAGLDVELRVGAVIANGAITKSGSGTLALAGDNTFTGTLTMGIPDPEDWGGSELVDGGQLRAESDNAFGDPATSRTISFGFEMALELGGGITLPATQSLDFEGSGDKIVNVSGSNRILGSITVAHDSSLNVASGTRLDFDGAITSPSWLYKTGAGTLVFGASSPAFTGRIFANAGTVLVNGSIAGTSQTPVANGATLGGAGTVPVVTLAGGATLAPGNSPGTLSSGNVTFNSGSTFVVELHGTTAGTQYDQVNVTGTVSLGGATLNLTLGYAATSGDTFVLINNDGADAVSGTFSGLTEGTIFTADSDRFQVSYVGGDGNDVVLTYDPNQAPTDIALSNTSVNQSGGENATVGTLSTTDADESDTHTYTLVDGDGDTDNASFNISESSLRASVAGSLAAGEYSVRVQTDDGRGGTFAKTFAVTVVDDVAPVVSSVAAPADGTYRADDALNFMVNFNETVIVTGVPTLGITIGEEPVLAAYQSGNGTTALTFRYLVHSGDEDTDGVAIGTLGLAGGSIRDAADNDAVLTLNNVEATAGVLVDAVAPHIVSISRKTPIKQNIDVASVVFEVVFSEAVTGVKASMFAITAVNDGTVTGTVAEVSGGPATYDVTINLTGGGGEFRLDVAAQ